MMSRMRWFKKKVRPESETIAAFWQWWSNVHTHVATAITAGGVSSYTPAFCQRVEAIHPDLQWELTPGTTAKHGLVVSPGGQPELRALAARWLAAAPSSTQDWEYRSERVADASVFASTIVINDHKLELSQLRYAISVNQDIHQIDVTCYHPEFAALPEGVRGQITFLSLDWAIGESNAEIWIGEVGFTTIEPAQPKTPQDLRNAVAAIADDGQWVLMSGEKPDGTPTIASAAIPLRSARWPRFDLHVPVTVPYLRANEGQFPERESLLALREFEDQLTVAVGVNGAIIAHETSGRKRILHYYVDSQTNAQAQIEESLRTWPEGRATTKPRHDPGFTQVDHLKR
jgi:hypothetical protein